ncbi:hypothetical protein [Plebeiibacterium marinum]|uniref:Uncharacterized protein n=1 Tax=Plebeiibacterium marinum TaxID=2992111 RepID=A0AAE3MES8_9BACT|nr:hypothetical protein [Plebeiobacterium marinum]MCW3806131.1 hypothetical protein [Plebeiobacterium marinum]
MSLINKHNEDNSILNDGIEDIQIDVDEMQSIMDAEAEALNIDLDFLDDISLD